MYKCSPFTYWCFYCRAPWWFSFFKIQYPKLSFKCISAAKKQKKPKNLLLTCLKGLLCLSGGGGRPVLVAGLLRILGSPDCVLVMPSLVTGPKSPPLPAVHFHMAEYRIGSQEVSSKRSFSSHGFPFLSFSRFSSHMAHGMRALSSPTRDWTHAWFRLSLWHTHNQKVTVSWRTAR